MEYTKTFRASSAEAVKDKERQVIFDDNISRLNTSVYQAKLQYSNLELARKRAGYIRHKAINGMEKYLIEFEANLERNGGKVVWALDAEEAVSEIIGILNKHNIREVTKSKSIIADEIDLYEGLNEHNIDYLEVNPAEFILRQFDEKPYHPSLLLVNKTLIGIVEKLHEKLKTGIKLRSQEVYNSIRKHCREKFESAKASISGANFVIADTGSVCICEDSGDAAINSTLPKIQIVVAGIDRIIPSIMNLDALIPLYSTYSKGQSINSYNLIVSGPRHETEKDGPSELYVILLDNGRSNVLARKFQRRALSCIECGACHNACPVYRKIGGDSYASTYTGPIGAVITPWMKGFLDYNHLSYASTLCGKCTEVCPVMINLHEQLLYNRSDSVKMKNHSFSDSLIMGGWHKFLKSRKWLDWLSPQWKNRFLKRIYLRNWGEKKQFPQVKTKSFKQLWEEQREGKA